MFEQLISIETFGGLVGLIVAVLALYELLIILPLRLRLRRCAAALAALEQRTAGLPALERKHNALARDVDGRLRQLGERIGQIELRSESRPYERAIDAAARGGPAERLVAAFGLTEGEASLVRLLHGKRRGGANRPAEPRSG